MRSSRLVLSALSLSLIIGGLFIFILITSPGEQNGSLSEKNPLENTPGDSRSIPPDPNLNPLSAFSDEKPFFSNPLFTPYLPPLSYRKPAGSSASTSSSQSTSLNGGSEVTSPPSFIITPPPLPVVTDSELTISTNGAQNITAFAELFAQKVGQMQFDRKKFYQTIPRNSKDQYLFSDDLIKQIITGNTSSQTKNALLTFKEYGQSKMKFISSLPVSGGGTKVAKIMLGFEKLDQELIASGLGYLEGNVAKTELETLLQKHQTTRTFYHRQLTGQAFAQKTSGFFASLIEFLGLEQIVYASVSPFGGMISYQDTCTCSAGYTLKIGNPSNVDLYIAFAQIGLLYDNRNTSIGTWMLGTYSPGGSCQDYHGEDCGSSELTPQGTISMAGTS